jgi:hypothetical protein
MAVQLVNITDLLLLLVSDYRLDDQRSIPGRGLCAQTSSEPHPASCPLGTGGKAWPDVTLTTHHHPVPSSRISMSYASNPPWRLHGGSWTSLLYYYSYYYSSLFTLHISLSNAVSIVPVYGLDDRAIEIRSPVAAKGFFL